MLTRIILFPCVFISVNETQIIIIMLMDILRSGIILIDDQNQILQSIEASINNWNPKFKRKAKEILKKLKKKNRFVKVSTTQPLISNCNNQIEENCIKVFTSEDFYRIIARHNQCANNGLVGNRVSLLEDYAISCLVDKLRKSSLTLITGEWKQDRFEEEILIPLFRDAKHIKIYDRWIGRSALQGTTNHQPTLKWFLEVFQKVATIRLDTVFEVYCGIGSQKKDKILLPKAITALRKFEAEIQVLFPYFKLFIKEETFDYQLPHDRYLITNQTSIYIGRGFDLFVKANESYPRRIKDVQIGYCSNPEKVEPYYRDLVDL